MNERIRKQNNEAEILQGRHLATFALTRHTPLSPTPSPS